MLYLHLTVIPLSAVVAPLRIAVESFHVVPVHFHIVELQLLVCRPLVYNDLVLENEPPKIEIKSMNRYFEIKKAKTDFDQG